MFLSVEVYTLHNSLFFKWLNITWWWLNSPIYLFNNVFSCSRYSGLDYIKFLRAIFCPCKSRIVYMLNHCCYFINVLMALYLKFLQLLFMNLLIPRNLKCLSSNFFQISFYNSNEFFKKSAPHWGFLYLKISLKVNL